ncbi:MAG: profilin domain protein [Petrotogales bacterium]
MKKLSRDKLMGIFPELVENPENTLGSYLYKGYRIQISKYGLDTNERVKALYRRRRKAGRCVVCGKKVTKKNNRTGKLYRLCEEHRKEIDRK